MKLSNSKKYKKDLDVFQNAVGRVVDTKRKVYYQKLLNEFIYQVKIIDDFHDSYNSAMLQPHIIKNNVENLSQLRHQLLQLVKDVR